MFTKTIKSTILNYICHGKTTCDDRDPPWINKDIKELIHDKSQAYKSFNVNKNNTFSLHQFEFVQSKLNSVIEKSKLNYYAQKIRCYIGDSACRWLIVENAKIFCSYIKHFQIFPRERNCRILIGLYE